MGAGFFYLMRERITNEELKRGIGGTSKSIKKMHELVAAGKLDPTIRDIATWIRLRVPQDERSQSRELADAIFWWVKKHGVFMRDPFQIERIEHPIASMRPVLQAKKAGIYHGPGLFAGDCDLYAIWMATLAGQLGYQYGFETIKTDSRRPDEFSHVYTVIRIDGQWVPFDPSSSQARPGWRPPVDESKRKVWGEEAIERTLNMSGLNGMSNDNGMSAWKDEPGYYPEDYFYGIPKYYDHGIENNVEPAMESVEPGLLDVHIPDEAALHRGDLATPADSPLKRGRPERASERRMMNQEDPYWDYYARPRYERKKRYLHAREPYPPGWPWQRQVARVDIVEPMVVEAVEQVGMGHHETYLTPGQVTYHGMTPLPPGSLGVVPNGGTFEETEAEVKKAEGGVLDSIGEALQALIGVIPGVGQVYVDRKKAQYAERVQKAGGQVLAKAEAGMVPEGLPVEEEGLFESPYVVAGALAAAAFAGYYLFLRPASAKRAPARRRTARRRR